MKAFGLKGQYLCFATGTWIGSILAGSVEQLFRPDSPSSRELPFEVLILLYAPFSLLLALLYALWIVVHSRRSKSLATLGWLVPFSLGLAYLPTMFGAIPLLIRVTGQGQGAVIGTCVLVLLFGLPIVAAEIAFRIDRPMSAPGRS